jgi:hypothetical protein
MALALALPMEAVPLARNLVWDVAMYPSGSLLSEAEGNLTQISLSCVSTTMVSTGVAGAHVQPVLEKRQLLAASL